MNLGLSRHEFLPHSKSWNEGFGRDLGHNVKIRPATRSESSSISRASSLACDSTLCLKVQGVGPEEWAPNPSLESGGDHWHHLLHVYGLPRLFDAKLDFRNTSGSASSPSCAGHCFEMGAAPSGAPGLLRRLTMAGATLQRPLEPTVDGRHADRRPPPT